MGSDHTQLQRAQARPVGPDGENALGRIEQHRAPAGAVVHPLVGAQLGLAQAQRLADLPQQRRIQRPAAAQRRRGKGQPRAVAPYRHQADAALLHHQAVLPRPTARRQPGVAAAERGVAGKGQLAAGGEDAHAVVGAGLGGRQQKGGLGQIGPAREGRHARVVQARRVVHHRQRVAAQRLGGEDIQLVEAPLHRRASSAAASTRPSAATPCSISGGTTVTKLSRSVFNRGAWQ